MTATATAARPDLGENQEGASEHRNPPEDRQESRDREQARPEPTDWQANHDAVVAWLPHATREAVEAFALRHFDRAESAAYLIAEQLERDQLIAERMASIEISQALDWTKQARRPSYAELTRRRSVVD